MKILVFSDTHLTDKFDKKQYIFLKNRFERVDQIIINGDLWDGQLISLDTFIASPWKALFPLLKDKKTIYIYGNHDKERFNDKRIRLFSDKQGTNYKFKSGKYIFFIEHGNKFYPFHDDTFPDKKVSRFMVAFLAFLESVSLRVLGNFLHKLAFKQFNTVIKNKLPRHLKANEIYVCGHTHFAEIDLEHQFINTGLIQHGVAQYLIVENGTPTLIEERY